MESKALGDPFFIEFQSGEVIWFRADLLKYFETLNQDRKRQKKKSDTFRFPGEHKQYSKVWQLTLLIYREHNELYGNTKGRSMPLRSEMMDRTLKTIQLSEMYNLIYVLYRTGAALLLVEVIKELTLRLLPMSASQLYLLHPNALKMEDEEARKRVKETADDPLHRINMPYYAKLAHLENIFKTYLVFDELVKATIAFLPQTKSITACGATHSLILTPSGLYACGDNSDGKLGIEPSVLLYANNPIKVPLGEQYEVISVKCSAHHTMILTTNGLYTCGSNSHGQLALGLQASGSIAMTGTPQRVPLDNVIEYACSNEHSLFLTAGGRLYGAGSNQYSQLGLGDELFDHQFRLNNNFFSPMRIPFYSVHTFVAIACGARHSLFLTSDDYLYACGDNTRGQCGSDPSDTPFMELTEIEKFVPIEEEESHNIQAIACGEAHSVVLDRRGYAYSFGDNSSYQLGLGDRKIHMEARRIRVTAQKKEEEGEMEVEVKAKAKAKSVKISAIYCGPLYTMLVGVDGLLYAFGENKYHSQLGVGETDKPVSVPTLVNKLQDVLSVSCGVAHTMVLASGVLYVCGNAGKAMGLGVNIKHSHHVKLITFGEQGKASSVAKNKAKYVMLKSFMFHPSELYKEEI